MAGQTSKGGGRHRAALVRLLRVTIIDDALNFTAKVRGGYPHQSTEACFNFVREVWLQVIDDALAEAAEELEERGRDAA